MSGSSSQPLPPAPPIPRVSVPVQQLQNPSPAQPVLHPQLTPQHLSPTEQDPAYTPYPDPGIMEPPGNSNQNKPSSKDSTSTERDLGFASAFPQDEKTQTLPAITEALERVYHYTKFGVYHGCVVVVGFPATAMWAIFAALFSFSFTWFMLPCVNILSVGTKMCLPLLHLPMKILTDVISPFLDKILQYVRQCRGRNC